LKCPKCHADNPEDTRFCGNCAAPLHPSEEISVSRTKTIQKPSKESFAGKTFAEKYKVIEELGRGGMGIVYKAQDTKLKRTVALKFLPPELTHLPEVKERFRREAQAAAALDHPHICTVYEVDEDEGKAFISMAYVEGQSLKKRIEQGALKTDEALDIAVQVAEGLLEAHRKGVVHRDIKSANIMVDKKGQAKIMDFGLAKVAGGSLVTREGTTLGTAAYMSPEQARGEPVDHRTDIWSLGVVLYEMLSGQLPFRGERESSVMYSIEHKEPKPLKDINPDIPAELEQIVGKALTKNPQDRYQHIGELLDDLNSISKGFVPPKIKSAMRRARIAKIKRAYLYGGIGALFILLVAAGLYFFALRSQAIASIAVLPIENVNSDPETEYLSDGITETIINKLSQLPRLKKVISRDSVFAYKGQKIDPKKIGQELDVKAVLTSRMIQRGDELSLSVSLINTTDNSHIWGEKYTRRLEDIFEVEEEIATAITKALQLKLKGEEKQPLTKRYTDNTEAYKLYLKAGYAMGKATEEEFQKCFDYLQQALEEDPTYALAYSGLAGLYAMLGYFKLLPPEDAYPRAKAAAVKALELDENLAEAYDNLAVVKFFYEWDWTGAQNEIKRAIELNPNLEGAHAAYSYYYNIMGRREEAIAKITRALELNPLSEWMNTYYGFMLLLARQHDQAIKHLQKALKIYPNNFNLHMNLGWNYSLKGRHDEAIKETEKAVELSGNNPMMVGRLGRVLAVAGRREEAMKILNEMLEQSKAQRIYVSPYYIAVIYLKLGQKDKAFKWFEKAYEVRDDMIIHLNADPDFDPISSDPRFQALLKKMKLDH